MMPLTRSRSSLVRWRPPRLAGGISGLTSAHSSSVRSLGYRSSSRLCRARVAVFHMSHLTKRWRPGNHGRSSGFKSSFLVARQPTHMTRKPPGRTLSTSCQWRYVPKDLPPKSTLHEYLDRWNYDGTLENIHHVLYVKCREQVGRSASPTACVIDSQSVKSAEKGGACIDPNGYDAGK